MTPEGRKRLKVALVLVLSAGFALLAHAAIVQGLSPTVGALLSLVPAFLILGLVVARKRHRLAALAAAVVLAVAVWAYWPQLERHFRDLFFVQHLAINLALAIVFGRTLFAGREPLVTRFARMVHGTLPPEVERYARQVTVAWTAFFLLLLATSCILYFARLPAAWSAFANIASPILVVLMFVVEYGVRHRVLPDWERAGILGGARAFARHFQAARFEAPR